MKKLFAVLMCMTVLLGIGGCSTNDDGKNAKNEEKINITELSAEEICSLFKESGIPISKIIVYNEETDVNELLGRPGSYTSKVNFADQRVGQNDINENPVGGSFEIFENEKDATKRHEYIESLESGPFPPNQYKYQYKNILLRVDNALTPKQTKQYEDALTNLQNGEKPDKVTYTPKTVKEKLIYNGYYHLTDNIYAKVVDKKKNSNYYLNIDQKQFQISEDNNPLTYNWETGDDPDNIKTVFEKELKDSNISLNEFDN